MKYHGLRLAPLPFGRRFQTALLITTALVGFASVAQATTTTTTYVGGSGGTTDGQGGGGGGTSTTRGTAGSASNAGNGGAGGDGANNADSGGSGGTEGEAAHIVAAPVTAAFPAARRRRRWWRRWRLCVGQYHARGDPQHYGRHRRPGRDGGFFTLAAVAAPAARVWI